jgi:hypothetical protein
MEPLSEINSGRNNRYRFFPELMITGKIIIPVALITSQMKSGQKHIVRGN